MTFEVHSFGPVETNSFLLSSSQEKKAYIFDAPPGSYSYWGKRAGELSFSIAGLLLTHSHWDHIADAAAFKEYYHLPIWIHSEDADNLRSPGSDGLALPLTIKGIQPDYILKDGDILSLDDLSLTVIHTPGHSPGSVCFYFPERATLISGDTLFAGGIGRLDLPTARPQHMKHSLQKLLKLPPNTQVFPGHGEATSIEGERAMINYLCEEKL